MDSSKSRKRSKVKVLSKQHLQSAHSFRSQVQPLRQCLFQLHMDLFKSPKAAQTFSDYVSDGIIHQGSGFLKIHRSVYVQALKVLGHDTPEFAEGLKFKSGRRFPHPYNAIFQRLVDIRDRIVRRNVTTNIRTKTSYDSKFRKRIEEVREEISSIEKVGEVSDYVPEIRSLLTLVNWPKFVKLESTIETREEVLDAFAEKITSRHTPQQEHRAALTGDMIATWVRSFRFDSGRTDVTGEVIYDRIQNIIPFGVDLSLRTYKGRKDSIGKIPKSVAYILQDLHHVNPIWVDKGPQATSVVLDEAGGKTRVISGYNGLINSTNAYDIITTILDQLPGDVSRQQEKGHDELERFTSIAFDGKRPSIVSADLSEFTDNMSLNLVYPLLDELGMHDFGQIIQTPIVVNKRVVKPLRLLMGLRGCFELATLVHHGIVNRLNSPYVMCGDDLVFLDSGNVFHNYQVLIEGTGQIINRSKSIVSQYLGVFCGKAFLLGADISPIKISIFNLTEPGIPRSLRVSSAANTINNIHRASLPKAVRKNLISFVVRFLGRSDSFIGRPLPKHLPFKMGGLGVGSPQKGGLLKQLSRLSIRAFCRAPCITVLPDAYITRRYVPDVWGDKPLFHFTPNLLVAGGYRKNSRYSRTEATSPLNEILSCLEYYYFGTKPLKQTISNYGKCKLNTVHLNRFDFAESSKRWARAVYHAHGMQTI